MTLLENLWWLLVLIGVMILVHELGHYWAARFFDVRVEVFSFGFGPKLFGFRRGETDFRFSLFLLGGYVKMTGEQPGDESANDPRSFQAKPRWQRLIIALAGPAMNFVLAVALVTGMFMLHYPKPPEAILPGSIGYVEEGSPAARAGIRPGDRIIEIGGVRNPSWDDILMKELASAGRPLQVKVQRDHQILNFQVTPVYDAEIGAGRAGWRQELQIEVAALLDNMPAATAGIRPGDIILTVNGRPVRSTAVLHEEIHNSGGRPVELLIQRDGHRRRVLVRPKLTQISGQQRYLIGVELRPRVIYGRLPIHQALVESVRHNVRSAGLILEFLKGIVERRMSAKSLEGPIRIAQLSGEAAREGAWPFISLMATVSLNLAVFNLLPIPILDGGVILLLLIEMTLQRDLSMAAREAAIKVGLLVLFAVVMFVLYNDLQKVLPAGG